MPNYAEAMAAARAADDVYKAAIRDVEAAALTHLAEHGIEPGFEWVGSWQYGSVRRWRFTGTVRALKWYALEPRAVFECVRLDGGKHRGVDPSDPPIAEVIQKCGKEPD